MNRLLKVNLKEVKYKNESIIKQFLYRIQIYILNLKQLNTTVVRLTSISVNPLKMMSLDSVCDFAAFSDISASSIPTTAHCIYA